MEQSGNEKSSGGGKLESINKRSMLEAKGDLEEREGMDQVFASAHYYFPILICTRREHSRKPGELQYEAVGIPVLVELGEESRTQVQLHYEHIERPIRLEPPKTGQQCTQYYHGHCYNALIKTICKLDLDGVRRLLKAHKEFPSDEMLPIQCTCGKAHHSHSLVSCTDCFGANALNTAVRVSMQVKGEARFRGREVCRELLSHGASPNLVPSNRLASLDVTCEEGDVELMQILVRGGAFITTCVERIAKLRLVQSTFKHKNMTSSHEGFDMGRLELLLSEEVVLCAPDPLVSSFYLCVVLKRLRKRSPNFTEQLKELQDRLERITYHYLDLCSNGWEARTLVAKEVLSTRGGARIPLYEYAVMCEQKHFCSHKHIQNLTSEMWYTSSKNGESYLQLARRSFSALLINIAFPLWLVNRNIRKQESSLHSWEHKVFNLSRIPSVCFGTDVVNHLILAALLIYCCQLDTFNLTFVETTVWLACLSRLIIEYDFVRMQGARRYCNDISNVVNIVVGCTFALTALAWIIAATLPDQDDLKVKLITITRYVYALAASGILVKLSATFKINETLGPLTNTIQKMTQDLLTFIVLLALIMVMFSIPLYTVSYQSYLSYTTRFNGTGTVLPQNANFDSYMNSVGFLTFSIFGYGTTYAGSLEYDNFSSTLMNSIYVLYLIALVILLMNLLIAVLNTTYANCRENATRQWKFSRVEQLIKYRGVQPFMFPFLLYLYPLYKVTLYSSRYIADSTTTKRRELLESMARDEVHAEGVRQNFFLHRTLKLRYREKKMGAALKQRIETCS